MHVCLESGAMDGVAHSIRAWTRVGVKKAYCTILFFRDTLYVSVKIMRTFSPEPKLNVPKGALMAQIDTGVSE